MAVDAPRRLDHRSAAELRSMDASVEQDENVLSWTAVRAHARRIHLSVVAERPDLALHSAGQIVSLADRRLRQLGESTNDAA